MYQHDSLLKYYQQQLQYVKSIGAEFASKYPKIAARLRLSEGASVDPHVERLIEAVAFLAARVEHKLEDNFSEISRALLDVLHPNFLAPIPSMSIAQFYFDPHKHMQAKTIPKATLLAAQACYFSTCYPVALYPLQIHNITLLQTPLPLKAQHGFGNAETTIKIAMAITNQGVDINNSMPDKLIFYINASAPYNFQIFELLMQHTLNIAITSGDDDPIPILLTSDCLRAVAYDDNYTLLPSDARVVAGYQLLAEYFSMPEKFLFVALENIQPALQKKMLSTGSVQICFHFTKDIMHLRHMIGVKTFSLGCTPIINLFPRKLSPFKLSQQSTEYSLSSDKDLFTEELEIYNISKVVGMHETYGEKEYRKCYQQLSFDDSTKHFYYQAIRRPAWQGDHYIENGSDTVIRFIDDELNFLTDNEWVIAIDAICSNRNAIGQFDYQVDTLTLAEAKISELQTIRCLAPLTKPHWPSLIKDYSWALVSHLSFNHLSLTNDEQGINALRSILSLYDVTQSDKNKKLFLGLLGIKANMAYTRHPKPTFGNVYWQGQEICLQVDPQQFADDNLYIFASILERFFASYAPINTYTQLVIYDKYQQELFRWQPRVGNQLLL